MTEDVFKMLARCDTWIIALEALIEPDTLQECLDALQSGKDETALQKAFKKAISFSTFPEGPLLQSIKPYGKKVVLTTRIFADDPDKQKVFIDRLFAGRGIRKDVVDHLITARDASDMLQKLSALPDQKTTNSFLITPYNDDIEEANHRGIKTVHFMGRNCSEEAAKAFFHVRIVGGLLYFIRKEMGKQKDAPDHPNGHIIPRP